MPFGADLHVAAFVELEICEAVMNHTDDVPEITLAVHSIEPALEISVLSWCRRSTHGISPGVEYATHKRLKRRESKIRCCASVIEADVL